MSKTLVAILLLLNVLAATAQSIQRVPIGKFERSSLDKIRLVQRLQDTLDVNK